MLLLVSWNYCCGIAISDISKILLIFGWIFSANVRQRQARKRRGRGGDACEACVQVVRGVGWRITMLLFARLLYGCQFVNCGEFLIQIWQNGR